MLKPNPFDAAAAQWTSGLLSSIARQREQTDRSTNLASVIRAQVNVVPNLTGVLGRQGSTFGTSKLLPAILKPQLEWLEGFDKSWPAPVLARITVPRLELPRGVLGIDWAAVTRRWRVPSNWPDEFEEFLPRLIDIVNVDGIPVAWVPRTSLLELLLTAESSSTRSALLVEHRGGILEDCHSWVDELDDEVIAPQLPIARKVLSACDDGHWEVAAISAVALVHAVVESLHWATNRQSVRKHHLLTMEHTVSQLIEQVTRAPLVPFYDEWNPKSGRPRPAHLTRHVVSHSLAADQVTQRNCIVAVMLMTSLLVSVDRLELGRHDAAA